MADSVDFFDWNTDQVSLLCFGYIRWHLSNYNVQIDDIARLVHKRCATFDIGCIYNKNYAIVNRIQDMNNSVGIRCSLNIVPYNDYNTNYIHDNIAWSLNHYTKHRETTIIFKPFIADLFEINNNTNYSCQVNKLTIVQKHCHCINPQYDGGGYRIRFGLIGIPKKVFNNNNNNNNNNNTNNICQTRNQFLQKFESLYCDKIKMFSYHNCGLLNLRRNIKEARGTLSHNQTQNDSININIQENLRADILKLTKNIQSKYICLTKLQDVYTCTYIASKQHPQKSLYKSRLLNDKYCLNKDENDFVQVCVEKIQIENVDKENNGDHDINTHGNDANFKYKLYFTKGSNEKFDQARRIDKTTKWLDFEHFEYMFAFNSPRCTCMYEPENVGKANLKGFEYEVYLKQN